MQAVYRRTTKYQVAREREYPPELPDLRMRITVERIDVGGVHVFEMHKTRRVDLYRVTVDGKPWKTCGLSKVLEGLRKATPRVLSQRALYD